MIEPNYLPFILIGGGIIFVILFFHYVPFFLWLSAKVSGVRISLIQLFLMRIRNVPPYVIVPAMIEAHKAGLSTITRDELEAHYMAGGHVEKVVHALVSASKANIELSFQMATGIDLAGRDVFEAVQMSVNPKVIDTPPVTAVAKDGIQLIAKARVTVRANIRQLVGGAGEDTILARVGEGIVSSIGSSENHKSVLENPDSISKLVLRKGLDAGTAFEILSIDIADIDIGRNIGAALQIDQANADMSVFGSIERFRTYTPALVPCKMAFVQQALEGNLLLCARFPAIIQKHDRVIGNEFFARSHPYRNRHAITRDISHKSGFRCPTVEDDHSLANGRPTRAVFRNTPDFLLMI